VSAVHAKAARTQARRANPVMISDRTVITHGLPRAFWQDLYHTFMKVSWPVLFLGFAIFFLSFNLVFAFGYWLDPDCIANRNPPGFAGDFFFSVETLATVGYGDMHPLNLYGHVIATAEIMVGLLIIALMTGGMFARFSRPRARVLFSLNGVVRPIEGQRTLMFRTANARQNIIMEASAQLRMLHDSVTIEGYRIRRIVDLPLVRSQTPIFLLGWSLMHVIDEHSPLAGETADTLAEARAVFLLNLSGTDETTGQVVMARQEYLSEAIRWNHSFRDVLHTDANGVEHLDYARFDIVDPLPDPALAAAAEGA